MGAYNRDHYQYQQRILMATTSRQVENIAEMLRDLDLVEAATETVAEATATSHVHENFSACDERDVSGADQHCTAPAGIAN